MKLSQILPVSSAQYSIEQRLFEFTLGITLCVFYFYALFGLVIGYHWPILSVYIFGSFIFTGFYIAQKRGYSFRVLTFTYYSILYLIITVAWLPSGGFKGAITNMMVLVFLSGLLILKPKDFLIFAALALAQVVIYGILEVNNPDLAAAYLDQKKWLIDLAVSNVIMLSLLGFAMFVFKRTYLKDRRQLKIANEDLIVQKQKAEAADSAKTTFLANISHEMRTPLNGIMGTSELLANSKVDSEQERLISDLTSSAHMLHDLISDVLDITMIEEERLVLNNERFNLTRLIEELIHIFRPSLSLSKEVRLPYHIDEDIPEELFGDPIRLRQVLINLVNNALKFTEKGKVSIEINTVLKNDESITIQFAVSDTGIGIPEEQLPFVFDKFYKEGTFKNLEEGTGLGLSICKKLVEAMAGSIAVESTIGQGSRFIFELPFSYSMNSSSDAIEKHIDSSVMANLKFLIAEDQKINQLVVTKMLTNLGVLEIDIASSGVEAVTFAKSKRYDFILMDIRMPDMDGIEATKQILKLPNSASTHIFALTANAFKEDKEACLQVGMKEFISKPFNSETLEKAIMKWI